MGKKAKLLFSWDEFDRLRKVPVNVQAVAPELEACIGMPYVDVKNPFPDSPCKTYAEHFEQEFERSIGRFGIKMDYRHQAEMYRSGKYAQQVLHALKHRAEIFEILDSHRTQEATDEERKNFYPVSIYCPVCGKDTTKITSLSEDCTVAEYRCSCGHEGRFDFTKDFNCKLSWKVDWAMRWLYEGVDFEPGGKDHASPNGSYDTSKEISKAIFGYEAPIFQGYEFIGIKGTTGKMSGSSGLNLTPDTLLKLYQPEIILWLYSKTEPLKAFDFCFDDGILRQYFEFDRMYNEVKSGKANDLTKAILYNAEIEGRTVQTVPMNLLVQLGSVVDFKVDMLELVFRKIGTPYTFDQFSDRLDRAKFWLEQCSPESVNRLRATRNWEVYDTLSETQRAEVARLYAFISAGGYTLDELNAELYAIPKEFAPANMEEKALKGVQGAFFKNVYQLLIDKERGPRLYLFLYAIDPAQYVNLLDFSSPKTQAEKEAEEAAKQAQEQPKPEREQVAYGDPDPVDPVKAEIAYDDFAAMDMRVCKVLKCQEIRKSHSCYKLTLSDGLDKRTIVSSIKAYYTPEELVGKKIIVLANLKPTRITGVTSEGMLLAATNNACGCKVIFVDDTVPEGTKIL